MMVEEVIQTIIRICEGFSVSKVYLYGSRAKGTNRERSDIDIAIAGAADFQSVAEMIEEIDTLYMIDLLNMDTCRNPYLLEDIETYGCKIYEKI